MLFFLNCTIQKEAAANDADNDIKNIQLEPYRSGQQCGYCAQAEKHAAENLFFYSFGHHDYNTRPRTNAL